MGGFVCTKNASVIPLGFSNNIILLFLKPPFKNPRTQAHTPQGVGGGGTGRYRVGRKSTCWKENSVTLGFPERRAIPSGAHSSDSPTPSEFAPSGPSERPGHPTPVARAPSRPPGEGHGRRVTSPGASGRGGGPSRWRLGQLRNILGPLQWI